MKALPFLLFATGALVPSMGAQGLCAGNGFGEAYLEVGPAYVGGKFVHDMGSPNVPGSFCLFSISDSAAVTSHPAIGQVCLDTGSAAYQVFPLPTDAAGNVHVEFALPNDPALLSFGPFFSNVATFEGGGWSISKTVPAYFELADSYTPLIGAMSLPRQFHTATLLGQDGRDNRIQVLIAGGGQGTVTVPTAEVTTELFDPLSRSFSPGPDLSVERALHTATLLQDGRVLITGGMDSIGICTRTCEVYDPQTGTFSPTGDMSTERASHTANLLPDGRVLVSGGLQNYLNPSVAFALALSSAQASAEVWDPATGLWTATANDMGSNRAGHSATTLADGRILVAGGVFGGFSTGLGAEAPLFNSLADLFDPATDTFAATAPMPEGRAYHGHTLQADGSVLMTGGALTAGPAGEAEATTSCIVWDSGVWSTTGFLPRAVAWHSQVPAEGGALVQGGMLEDLGFLLGSEQAGIHDGSTFQSTTDLGLNPGIPGSSVSNRGNHTATRLHDGSYLILGGFNGLLFTSEVFDSGFIYTP